MSIDVQGPRARRRARSAALAAGLLILTACGPYGPTTSGSDDPTGPGATADGGDPVALDQISGGPAEQVPSALDDMNDPDLPEPLISPAQIVSGGPPPDGIPAVDEPTFQRVGSIDWLEDAEAILSVSVGDETRGYPVQILMWHEIVNDTIAGTPIAATYCPLCNSGVAFDRRVGDRILDFGTSGRLYASNLVMYDRQTESLWPQLTGTAAVGVLTGTALDSHPMIPVSWRDFREAHPDAWVLSRETGHSRNYGTNPYVGYDQPDTGLLFHTDPGDGRLGLKTRILALTSQDLGADAPGDVDRVAVARGAVAEDGVLEFTLGATDLVAWHLPGQASSLEDSTVAGGSDIGSVAVYEPVADGEQLTFTRDDSGFTDAETGSTWNILGDATDGPLAGQKLRAVPFIDTFWFTWATFQPDTRVVP
ncbi:DUF3179 domain-containing protein [Promicromonospora soli]